MERDTLSINYCPICGIKRGEGESLVGAFGAPQHRCDPRTLAAIDRALGTERQQTRRKPSMNERLKEGFQALADEEKEDSLHSLALYRG